MESNEVHVEKPEADDKNNFDADARSAERGKRAITIKGVVYHPRRRTGRVIKEILEIDTDKHDDESDRQFTGRSIDILYEQVSILLRDDQGNAPDIQAMQEEDGLEMEDARDLLTWLGATDEKSEDEPSPTTAQD